MSGYACVDVVIADGKPDETPLDYIETQEPPQVDVTPDPRRRVILIAPTKPRGQHEARTLGIEPVAIVAPRTPDAARGHTADEIVWSEIGRAHV